MAQRRLGTWRLVVDGEVVEGLGQSGVHDLRVAMTTPAGAPEVSEDAGVQDASPLDADLRDPGGAAR